jgi:hypothetical protein
MADIPDYTGAKFWVVVTTLEEQYEKGVVVDQADTEIRLYPGAKSLTLCPTLHWGERGAHFVIVKTAESDYRARFYYRLHQIYGTGIEEIDDPGDCTVTVLQVQADHGRDGSVQAG